jgi:hypothetical protein
VQKAVPKSVSVRQLKRVRADNQRVTPIQARNRECLNQSMLYHDRMFIDGSLGWV